jgi:hypothetical protein
VAFGGTDAQAVLAAGGVAPAGASAASP